MKRLIDADALLKWAEDNLDVQADAALQVYLSEAKTEEPAQLLGVTKIDAGANYHIQLVYNDMTVTGPDSDYDKGMIEWEQKLMKYYNDAKANLAIQYISKSDLIAFGKVSSKLIGHRMG